MKYSKIGNDACRPLVCSIAVDILGPLLSKNFDSKCPHSPYQVCDCFLQCYLTLPPIFQRKKCYGYRLLSFGASSDIVGEEDLALAAGGGRARISKTERYASIVFAVFDCWKHVPGMYVVSRLLFSWSRFFCFFIMFLVVGTRAMIHPIEWHMKY